MVQIYDLMDWSVLPDEYLPDDYTGPSAGSISSIIGKSLFLYVYILMFLIR